MTVNASTLDLITEFEGWVPNWYPDPAYGWKVPTCCYGHTDAAGEPKYATTKDKVFTKQEGRDILSADLGSVEAKVLKLVKRPLNENQFGALTSFTFNLGEGNFASSTLLKKVNAGDLSGAASEFGKWNHANGSVMAGLTRRRAAEAALFLKPVSVATNPHLGPVAEGDIPVAPIRPAPKPASHVTYIIGGVILAAVVIYLIFIKR